MPQAVNHLWEVLLVSSLGQSQDDLHEVSVHQSTVRTFCCLQSLTKQQKIKDQFRLCLSSFITYEPAEEVHAPF